MGRLVEPTRPEGDIGARTRAIDEHVARLDHRNSRLLDERPIESGTELSLSDGSVHAHRCSLPPPHGVRAPRLPRVARRPPADATSIRSRRPLGGARVRLSRQRRANLAGPIGTSCRVGSRKGGSSTLGSHGGRQPSAPQPRPRRRRPGVDPGVGERRLRAIRVIHPHRIDELLGAPREHPRHRRHRDGDGCGTTRHDRLGHPGLSSSDAQYVRTPPEMPGHDSDGPGSAVLRQPPGLRGLER